MSSTYQHDPNAAPDSEYEPGVLDFLAAGMVFVADVSGTLHAIGCENPPDCEPSG